MTPGIHLCSACDRLTTNAPDDDDYYFCFYVLCVVQNDELSFDEGDLLYILDMSNGDWWKAKCGDATGLIPSNYGILS